MAWIAPQKPLSTEMVQRPLTSVLHPLIVGGNDAHGATRVSYLSSQGVQCNQKVSSWFIVLISFHFLLLFGSRVVLPAMSFMEQEEPWRARSLNPWWVTTLAKCLCFELAASVCRAVFGISNHTAGVEQVHIAFNVLSILYLMHRTRVGYEQNGLLIVISFTLLGLYQCVGAIWLEIIFPKTKC